MKAWHFCIHFSFVSFILCLLFTGQVGTLMIREVSVSKQVIPQVQGWIVHKPSVTLKNKMERWNRLFSRWEQDLCWEDCVYPGTECLLGTRFVSLAMTVTINRLIVSCVVGVDITLSGSTPWWNCMIICISLKLPQVFLYSGICSYIRTLRHKFGMDFFLC